MEKKENEKREITEVMIDKYCQWLRGNEKSESTIKKYRRDLILLMQYLNGKGVEKNDIINWKGFLRERLAPVTVNSVLAAANGFFSYYGWDDCRIKFLKISRNVFYPERREIGREEYKRLVKTAYAKGDEKTAVILQTICATGIRISETVYVTVEAVKKGKAEVECKGKIRTVFFTGELSQLLMNYARRHGITQGMIFITRNGKPMDRSNVWRNMKRLCEEAKVTWEKVFPHHFRHLFARLYYEQDRNLVKLADILGHSNINTTRIYTMESSKNYLKQLEKLNVLFENYNKIPLLL